MSDEIKMQGESIMNEPKNELTEKEMKFIEDTEVFMDEVYDNPEVAEAEPPSVLRKRVFAEIRAREVAKREAELKVEKFDVEEEEVKAEKLNVEEVKAEKSSTEEKEPEVEKLTAEEKEFIYLGRIYKQRRKLYRVLVVAAVLVMAMAFGITSIGGPEKVFEMVKSTLMGYEQINVDSDNISRTAGMSEEEAYQEIEKTFNFVPVALNYLPKGVGFLEAEIGEEIQAIHLFYGKDDKVKISVFIRPNYREGSYGKDIEDVFLEEYTRENKHAIIHIRKYLVEESEERWSVQFEYKDTLYTMTIMDTSKDEVEKIVENLFFS